jgi:Crp-like helix-turn-helix domain
MNSKDTTSPPPAEERPGNNLLRLLRSRDYALIAPHLRPMQIETNEVLYNPGDNVETVYFPCGPSLVSLAVTNEDGRDVETIMIGREGAVGGIVSSGHLPAYCRIAVRHGGSFVRLWVSHLEVAKSRSLALRYLFARYADCILAQVFQSTACNAIHSIEQRTAKWLLATMERTGNHLIALNQEQLAAMLGVGRSYASRVIQTFRAEGILETGRGSILVRDEQALKARSCSCNASVKSHFETVLRGAYPQDET